MVCVACVREECGRHEQRVRELEAKLRTLETSADWTSRMPGLCVSCAQNEAVCAPSQLHDLTRSLSRLSLSSDDILVTVTKLIDYS